MIYLIEINFASMRYLIDVYDFVCERKGASHTKACYVNDESAVHVVGVTGGKGHYVSILPTMVRCFGLEFFFGSILKFMYDILQFISPQLIKFVQFILTLLELSSGSMLEKGGGLMRRGALRIHLELYIKKSTNKWKR